MTEAERAAVVVHARRDGLVPHVYKVEWRAVPNDRPAWRFHHAHDDGTFNWSTRAGLPLSEVLFETIDLTPYRLMFPDRSYHTVYVGRCDRCRVGYFADVVPTPKPGYSFGEGRVRPDELFKLHSSSNVNLDGKPLLWFDCVAYGLDRYSIGPFGVADVWKTSWHPRRSPDLDAWYKQVVSGNDAAAAPLVDWLLENGPPEFVAALQEAMNRLAAGVT